MTSLGNSRQCEVSHCVYNRDRKCGREYAPSISWKESGEFCCGKRVGYPVCDDYKELDDDGDG